MTVATPDETRTLTGAAKEAGITVLDHADIYRGGDAEAAFGAVFKNQSGLRNQLIVQSKCGIRFGDKLGPRRYDSSRAWIERSVEGSLKRLQTYLGDGRGGFGLQQHSDRLSHASGQTFNAGSRGRALYFRSIRSGQRNID